MERDFHPFLFLNIIELTLYKTRELKVSLKSGESLKSFVATNEKGHKINLSGDGSSVGPMESVLMAIAGCSTIDIVMILEKMRQPLEHIEVEVQAERRDEIPKTFTKVNLHYKLTGDLKEKKVEQSINSSLDKYCSVSKMIEKSAEITSSYEILNKED